MDTTKVEASQHVGSRSSEETLSSARLPSLQQHSLTAIISKKEKSVDTAKDPTNIGFGPITTPSQPEQTHTLCAAAAAAAAAAAVPYLYTLLATVPCSAVAKRSHRSDASP
jgi:hypothetical protein